MRAFFLIFGVAVALLGAMWGVAEVSGSTKERFWDNPLTGRKKTVICYKLSDDVQMDGHACVYMCEDGEKTRVDKLKTCLPKIEI